MLTIGSIVYLKEGSRKLMILSRGSVITRADKGELFDYGACLYPVGLVPDEVFYFNEENIDKIVFEGYFDEEEIRFQELYQEWENENTSKVEKGYVDNILVKGNRADKEESESVNLDKTNNKNTQTEENILEDINASCNHPHPPLEIENNQKREKKKFNFN